jgi:hypothetical protein
VGKRIKEMLPQVVSRIVQVRPIEVDEVLLLGIALIVIGILSGVVIIKTACSNKESNNE